MVAGREGYRDRDLPIVQRTHRRHTQPERAPGAPVREKRYARTPRDGVRSWSATLTCRLACLRVPSPRKIGVTAMCTAVVLYQKSQLNVSGTPVTPLLQACGAAQAATIPCSAQRPPRRSMPSLAGSAVSALQSSRAWQPTLMAPASRRLSAS